MKTFYIQKDRYDHWETLPIGPFDTYEETQAILDALVDGGKEFRIVEADGKRASIWGESMKRIYSSLKFEPQWKFCGIPESLQKIS